MSRWFGFATDPTAGGTTLDVITDLAGEGKTPVDIAVPTVWVPVTSAQIDPGLSQLDRKDEVRGRRGDTAPISFASAPSLSIEARAYPALVRRILRNALGGAIDKKGGPSPKAYEDTVEPLQEGSLPALIGWLRREGQLDRVTGAVAGEFDLNFPIDQEGTITATLPCLYHDAQDSASPKEPDGTAAKAPGEPDYAAYLDTFMLRDATAFRGAESEEIEDLAGFTLTFNNGMIDDFRSRFRPNHNIEVATIDEVEHKLWYPAKHKIGAQAVTGTIALSAVDPDAEARRLLTHADKLVFEIAAGALGTTPAADEMLRLTLYSHASTGGGADPLVREGDQLSSFEFSGYIGAADNKDVAATFVGATALT